MNRTVDIVGWGMPMEDFGTLVGETQTMNLRQHKLLFEVLKDRIENTEEIRRNHVIIRKED